MLPLGNINVKKIIRRQYTRDHVCRCQTDKSTLTFVVCGANSACTHWLLSTALDHVSSYVWGGGGEFAAWQPMKTVESSYRLEGTKYTPSQLPVLWQTWSQSSYQAVSVHWNLEVNVKSSFTLEQHKFYDKLFLGSLYLMTHCAMP